MGVAGRRLMQRVRPVTGVIAACLFAMSSTVAAQSASFDLNAPQDIRVRLYERYEPTEVTIKAGTSPLPLAVDGESSSHYFIEPHATATIRLRGDQLSVHLPSFTVDGDFVEVTRADTPYDVRVARGRSTSAVRTYAGWLTMAVDPADPSVIRLINSVDLETYVAAVIDTEYGLGDLEGSRVMAVLARTYAIRSLGKFGADYDHVDHSLSQVYHGIGGLSDVAIAAATSTNGEVLTYGGELIQAVYHAESGGRTANNEDVWESAPIPYLRGKKDPYANASPYARWSFRADRSRLLRALSREFGGTATGIKIAKRSRDGRVSLMTIHRKKGDLDIQANQFRLLFLRTFGQYSMKSTAFDVKRSGGYYVFEGRGFGHGVGLSQWGAHEMAGRGRSYRDILEFYFTGVSLKTLEHLSLERLVAHRRIAPAPTQTLPTGVEQGADPFKNRPTTLRRIGW